VYDPFSGFQDGVVVRGSEDSGFQDGVVVLEVKVIDHSK